MTGMIIEGKSGKWEVICGLEIHCQIISKSKICLLYTSDAADE